LHSRTQRQWPREGRTGTGRRLLWPGSARGRPGAGEGAAPAGGRAGDGRRAAGVPAQGPRAGDGRAGAGGVGTSRRGHAAVVGGAAQAWAAQARELRTGATKGRGASGPARIAWPALNPVGQCTSRQELFNSRREFGG
jgi:hypothetical protein